MSAELLPMLARAGDTNNNPMSGAKWYFYETETLTPQAVYADADLSTSLGATVTADGAGKFVPIYFNATLSYRGILKSSDGATTIFDIDPINPGTLNDLSAPGGSELIGYQLDATGAVPRSAYLKLRELNSVKDFGATGLSSSYDTDAFQTAVAAHAAGEIGSLFLPGTNEVYRIEEPITVTDSSLFGLHIYGPSRTGSPIKQMTNDTPIFEFDSVDVMHSCEFNNLWFTWDTAQTGNTNATAMRFTSAGLSSESVYECNFRNIFVTNGDTFMRGDDTFTWGNGFEHIWADTKGGFVKLGGGSPGGQPRNRFDCYITGGAAGRILFDVPAMVAQYNVEVNDTEALMLFDGSGGHHTILRWDLELAEYASSGTLFNCPNGIITAPGLIRLDTISITGTAHIKGFVTNGTFGYLNAEDISVGVDMDLAAGAKFTLYAGTQKLSTIKRTTAPWTPANDSSAGVCQLTDVSSTTSAESLCIEEWINSGPVILAGDADVTLDYDSAATVIFGTVLTADRKVILPREGSVVGNNYFKGPRFKIIKLPLAGTTYKIDIVKYDGTTVVDTLLAATTSGSKTIRWDRASPIGTAGAGFLTSEPPPV